MPPADGRRAPRPTVSPVPLSGIAGLLGVLTTLDGRAADGVDVPVSGVTLDSRAVRAGDLYAALPGSRFHGSSFAGSAVGSGAVAVLTDPEGAQRLATEGPTRPVPVLVVDRVRDRLGAVAALVYGHPAQRLTMLGITGTNGKTTTAFLVDGGLRAAGRVTGVVGTVETRVAGRALPSERTTPEAPDVQALLALMVERGCDVCVMEVSSHALALGRVDGTVFDVAGFTNLSHDHLDFHGTPQAYLAAKASLFQPDRSRRAVVVVDDDAGRQVAAGAGVPVTTVSALGSPDADWRATAVEHVAGGGSRFVALGPDGERWPVSVRLPGSFNVANALLALVMLRTVGVSGEDAVRGLALVAVPGRMEPVDAGQGFAAMVDYAHTPDAVARALEAARATTPGRLLVVLGCGGDRDQAKRPAMGRVAATGADLVVITDDNPRTEDPADIRAAVLDGARAAATSAELVEEGDRRAALRLAVQRARGGDTVLVLGKGHEQGQEQAGTVRPFDDRVELRAAIEGLAVSR